MSGSIIIFQNSVIVALNDSCLANPTRLCATNRNIFRFNNLLQRLTMADKPTKYYAEYVPIGLGPYA